MNKVSILLSLTVLILGFVALLKIGRYEKNLKNAYEKEAKERINNYLARNNISSDEYKFFHYRPQIFWEKESTTPSNYNELIEMVIGDVTKGAGDLYLKSCYSIYVDKENKIVYFVIGRNNFDFSKIKLPEFNS